MEQVQANNINVYIRKHKLHRYIIQSMLRFMKYRLNHQHGVFTDARNAHKIENINHRTLQTVVVGDLVGGMISSRTNPTAFKETLKKAEINFTPVQAVLTTVMAQWRMYLTLEKLIRHGYKHDSISSDELNQIGLEVLDTVYLHAEHAVYVLANNDEILESVQPLLVSELPRLARDISEYTSDESNLKAFKKLYGEQGVFALMQLNHLNLELLHTAMEANEKPNDYDSF